MILTRYQSLVALVVGLTLITAACSGTSVDATTTLSPQPGQSATTAPTTSVVRTTVTAATTDGNAPTSSTSPATTTATTASVPAPTSTTVFISDVVVMGAFVFASGPGPRISVSVEVSETPDGPWLAAGSAQNPSITGPEFWIRFTIENRDTRGPITELDISGTDDGPIGRDVCPDQAPIAALATETCIVGPSPVVSGDHTIEFTVTASGTAQSAGNGEWFSPPLVPLGYQDAPTSFLFVFETNELPREGVLIEGTAGGDTVDVDIPGELVATISVDCSTPGEGSGFPVVAYSITTYDVDGAPTGGCDSIPTVTFEHTLDDLSDTTVNYTGG